MAKTDQLGKGRLMANYRIVSAKPKNAANHINSQFKLYKYNARDEVWELVGWKTINEVSSLMQAGHSVATGKINGDKISGGASVELELRITKNGTNYKISEMPDT